MTNIEALFQCQRILRKIKDSFPHYDHVADHVVGAFEITSTLDIDLVRHILNTDNELKDCKYLIGQKMNHLKPKLVHTLVTVNYE